MSSAAQVEQWWEAWVDRRDPEARSQLIEHHTPVVRAVACRIAAGLPSSVDVGDLVSAGVFGLIDAVERFDPTRGVKFETFAAPRIRGAIFDGLRSLDWVPRSVRARARELEQATLTLAAQLGRLPTGGEVSHHLRLSATEYRRWQSSIASTTVRPLERALDAGAEPRALDGSAPENPVAVVEDVDLRRRVRDEVRRLAPRDQLVMSFYYDEGLTLAEIGSLLGVTESRVSQIHSRAVALLRERLASAEFA